MENTTQPTEYQLNLKDLQGLKVCVEVACQRGAYRADEMQAIGTVYNNLSAFLKSVETPTPTAENTEAPQGE